MTRAADGAANSVEEPGVPGRLLIRRSFRRLKPPLRALRVFVEEQNVPLMRSQFSLQAVRRPKAELRTEAQAEA